MLACCILSVTWPRWSFADTAKQKYYRAEACYKKLRHSPKKQKYRCYWLGCIEKFQSVYRHNPSGPWAAAGLYMSGKLYQELYRRSFKASDKKAALDIYKRIIKGYPKSSYKRKAENAMRDLFPKGVPKIASKSKIRKQSHVTPPEDDIAKQIKKFSYDKTPLKTDVKGSKGNTGTVVGLRFWSNPSYTRVVIDADSEISYSHRLLKKDTAIRKPHRLYIDFSNSRLG
ncbi:MAG: N-acetylmuramoyl-L-alanine amidase, partial [Thermodesulfobacteriota bacterium]|nr:N-acetylmuramoyl-L-alanine amidase [Thermodesulfobacteriota bacterium]